MREPSLDHRETWEDFFHRKARRRAEIEVAYDSMQWWEREEAKQELTLLRFEIQYAEGHCEEESQETGGEG